jgi:CopA family copper-resistance protein
MGGKTMSFSKPKTFSELLSPSRRRFVLGAASAGAAMALGGLPLLGFARTNPQGPQVLGGNRFQLDIGYRKVNFTGSERVATAVNGGVPAPTLRWKEGDRVHMSVTNHLKHDSSIHWHGMILPTNMDGVPGLSFDGIKPGQTYEYEFDVKQSGTYWYHSHSGFQEQTGLYGAIVIEPKGGYPYKFDREHVVMLSDWSDEEPAEIYSNLKKMSDYYNFSERTSGDMMHDIKEMGLARAWNSRSMWNHMRMSDRDISDVTGYTYTFLMNGVTPDDGWVGKFRRGEKVLLRFINSSAMTFFDVRIPGLKMTVVAADGQYVKPVSIDEFRIGVAETYDVIVEPTEDKTYTVFAQTIDRSGYARGTLAPNLAMRGDVPKMDPQPILSHTDMGMDMGNMDMGGMEMGGHDMDNMPVTPQPNDMGNMPGMDHGGHDMGGMSGMNHAMGEDMDFGGAAAMGTGEPGYGSSHAIHHAETEYGPQVDMRADTPKYRLNDPGIGLRDHKQRYGRRVLTYADLRSLHPTRDTREPGREIELHLTGNMERYMWSINGIRFADAEPIKLKYGERVRITLVNDTMMNHPIHLHGMWSELETGDGDYIPRKHTIIVQPGAKISYLVTADAKGNWAYHCHLLYHMMGMFREVVVS